MTEPTVILAPGKLFWLGEYAVLDGAPAIVTAIDRWATITSVEAEHFSVTSDAFEGAFTDGFHPVGSELVNSVVSTIDLMGARRSNVSVHCATASFSSTSKLGIGSSAAVAAGLTTALASESVSADQVESASLRAHDLFQGVRGSGADVLASLYGGVCVVQDHRLVATLELPSDLVWAALFTGVSADTRKLVHDLRAWFLRDGREADRFRSRLASLAHDGVTALQAGDVEAWCEVVLAYAAVERQMSRISGVPIVDERVQTVIDVAVTAGFAAKPSGAGGGDMVVAFARETDSLQRLKRVAEQAGVEVVDLTIQTSGALSQRRDAVKSGLADANHDG